MMRHRREVVKVADEQIRHLATKSEEMSQETRVSIYRFHRQQVDCLIFDMDVCRLPSIKDLYTADGGTPLIDAVVKSQQDLATTSQIYGDHAFLTFVLTDGQENTSLNTAKAMNLLMLNAAENWTTGFLVPDKYCADYLAVQCGIDRDSIMTWDITSAAGMCEVGKTITDTTTSYMTSRSQGLRGTKSLFTTCAMGAANVNAKTVQATLTPMHHNDYQLHDVKEKMYIADFVAKLGLFYLVGRGFYHFTKPETIQGGKEIVVVDKVTGQAYGGVGARQLIGLQWGVEAKVKADDNPAYDIFVQSHSVNRNLIPGQKFLLMGPFSKSAAVNAAIKAVPVHKTPAAPAPKPKPAKTAKQTFSSTDAKQVAELLKKGAVAPTAGRRQFSTRLGISERRIMQAFRDPGVAALRK